jgi:carbohydrate diacid regulator
LGQRAHDNSPIHDISKLRPHQLVASTDRRVRARLTTAQLAGVHNAKDWPMLRRTLLAWGNQGFNLVSAAQDLHIHRNTLVLRLSRVAALTGRDLHDRLTALGVYLACLADLLDDDAAPPGQRLRRERATPTSRPRTSS